MSDVWTLTTDVTLTLHDPAALGRWCVLYLGHYLTARDALDNFACLVDFDFPSTAQWETRDGANPNLFYLVSPKGKRRSGPKLIQIYDRLHRTS